MRRGPDAAVSSDRSSFKSATTPTRASVDNGETVGAVRSAAAVGGRGEVVSRGLAEFVIGSSTRRPRCQRPVNGRYLIQALFSPLRQDGSGRLCAGRQPREVLQHVLPESRTTESRFSRRWLAKRGEAHDKRRAHRVRMRGWDGELTEKMLAEVRAHRVRGGKIVVEGATVTRALHWAGQNETVDRGGDRAPCLALRAEGPSSSVRCEEL